MCVVFKSFQESPFLFFKSLLADLQNVLDIKYVKCSSPMLKPAAATLIWKRNCAKETDKLRSQTAQLLQRAGYWGTKFNKPR